VTWLDSGETAKPGVNVVTVDANNDGLLGGQEPGRGLSDARGGAGHDHDPVIQL
jgi:hypothetical protein